MKLTNNTRQVMNIAWLRDGETIHTGNALLLAMLKASHGNDRTGQDAEVVRKIMKDKNL